MFTVHSSQRYLSWTETAYSIRLCFLCSQFTELFRAVNRKTQYKNFYGTKIKVVFTVHRSQFTEISELDRDLCCLFTELFRAVNRKTQYKNV